MTLLEIYAVFLSKHRYSISNIDQVFTMYVAMSVVNKLKIFLVVLLIKNWARVI